MTNAPSRGGLHAHLLTSVFTTPVNRTETGFGAEGELGRGRPQEDL